MNITDKNYNSRIQRTSAILDGILFNNIYASGIEKQDIMSRSTNIWKNASDEWFPAINAVDIDWNGAEVDENVILNSTPDLLNWIKNYQIKDIQINGESVSKEDGIINLGTYLTEHPSKGSKYLSYGATSDDITKAIIGLSIDKNGHLTYGKEISIQRLADIISNYLPQNHQNINVYTIQFKDDDNIIREMTGITGTYVLVPENPVKEGYEFIGWNTNIEAEEGIDVISNIGEENVTYYAIWKKIESYTWFGALYGEELPSDENISNLGQPVANPITEIIYDLQGQGDWLFFVYPTSWGTANIVDKDGDGVGFDNITNEEWNILDNTKYKVFYRSNYGILNNTKFFISYE